MARCKKIYKKSIVQQAKVITRFSVYVVYKFCFLHTKETLLFQAINFYYQDSNYYAARIILKFNVMLNFRVKINILRPENCNRVVTCLA